MNTRTHAIRWLVHGFCQRHGWNLSPGHVLATLRKNYEPARYFKMTIADVRYIMSTRAPVIIYSKASSPYIPMQIDITMETGIGYEID